jgi:hypothetical protein
MTIDLHATFPATAEPLDEIVKFVFRPAASSSLLVNARALLDAAPKELAESFEQAVRIAGLAS